MTEETANGAEERTADNAADEKGNTQESVGVAFAIYSPGRPAARLHRCGMTQGDLSKLFEYVENSGGAHRTAYPGEAPTGMGGTYPLAYAVLISPQDREIVERDGAGRWLRMVCEENNQWEGKEKFPIGFQPSTQPPKTDVSEGEEPMIDNSGTSDWRRMADNLRDLSEVDFHSHPEIQKRLAAAGVINMGGEEYTLEGHDMDEDLTDDEIALMAKKAEKVLSEFTQDVLDGKIKP